MRRNVTGRVDSAYYEFMARKTQVDLYGQSLVPSARKLEDLAEQSYQAGKANLLTVLSAQRDVQNAQQRYLESLLAAQHALASLEETVGVSID
jgi:outer membrane protein TolC